MDIPMKYEDVVAKLDAALGREAALREEIEVLKKVTNFKDAVACVFDMLKYAAANTRCKEWDSHLEDLAEDVIEFAPEYKKQWKDIGALQQRLTVAEQDNKSLRSQIGRVMVIFDMAADELVKDAARYRWLMSGSVLNGTLGIVGGGGWIDFEFKEEAGQKIDEAMQTEVAAEFNQAADRQATLPDCWPCKDHEELARYKAWILEDEKAALKPVAEGEGS